MLLKPNVDIVNSKYLPVEEAKDTALPVIPAKYETEVLAVRVGVPVDPASTVRLFS